MPFFKKKHKDRVLSQVEKALAQAQLEGVNGLSVRELTQAIDGAVPRDRRLAEDEMDKLLKLVVAHPQYDDFWTGGDFFHRAEAQFISRENWAECRAILGAIGFEELPDGMPEWGRQSARSGKGGRPPDGQFFNHPSFAPLDTNPPVLQLYRVCAQQGTQPVMAGQDIRQAVVNPRSPDTPPISLPQGGVGQAKLVSRPEVCGDQQPPNQFLLCNRSTDNGRSVVIAWSQFATTIAVLPRDMGSTEPSAARARNNLAAYMQEQHDLQAEVWILLAYDWAGEGVREAARAKLDWLQSLGADLSRVTIYEGCALQREQPFSIGIRYDGLWGEVPLLFGPGI